MLGSPCSPCCGCSPQSAYDLWNSYRSRTASLTLAGDIPTQHALTQSVAFVNLDNQRFDGLPTNDPLTGITTAQMESVLKSGSAARLPWFRGIDLPVFHKGVSQQTGTYNLSLDAGATAWNATNNTGLVRYLYGFTSGNRTGDVAIQADVQIATSTSRDCSVSGSVFLSLGSPYSVGPDFVGNYLPVSSRTDTAFISSVVGNKTVVSARVPCELFRTFQRSILASYNLVMYELGGLYETWGGVWEGDIRQSPTYSQRYHLGEVIPLTFSQNAFTATKSGTYSAGVVQVLSDSQADSNSLLPRERLYTLLIGQGNRGQGANYNTPNGFPISFFDDGGASFRLTGLANRSGKTLVTKTAYTANITLVLSDA